MYVGRSGSGNSLVISNQGKVISGNLINSTSYIGVSGISNSVLVAGAGSVWSNSSDLYVGSAGAGNSLVISNQGAVINNNATVGLGGFYDTSTNNFVRVVDGGVWRNNILYIGNQGRSNSLVVAGGSVYATNLIIGAASATCDNLVQLDSGDITVTNVLGTATLEVRRGVFILNGGTLRANKLIVTNSCARFIRTGGTLVIGSLVDSIPDSWKTQYNFPLLDPTVAGADPDGDGFTNLQEFLAGTDPTNSAAAFRITAIGREGNSLRVTWTMGSGKTNALQRTAGTGGSFSTNNFANIFIVTNTLGTVTNYLDNGAATNRPARYYRIRLVP